MDSLLCKHQVFVSSTYLDLRDAREKVTWALLQANFIPVGMENFSASDDRGWRTITRAIDQSDYYVVVVAGLYGSVDQEGKSWTEKEYDYAVTKQIPVLAFIREGFSTPGNFVEKGTGGQALDLFVKRLRTSHHVEEWTTEEDLAGKASVAVMKHARDDAADGRSRPGWYRGPLPSPNIAEELAVLSSDNRRLREKAAAAANSSLSILRQLPTGTTVKITHRSTAAPAPIVTDFAAMSTYAWGRPQLPDPALSFIGIDESRNVLRLEGERPEHEYRYPLDKIETVYAETEDEWRIVFGPYS